MNNIQQFFARFFKFTFLGKVESSRRIIDVDGVKTKHQKGQKPPFKEQVRNQLIIRINWVLIIVCLLSFTFIIIYPFVYPDKSVPDIIQNAFFTTLGWFGGVLGAFFQVEQNKNNL